MQKIFRFLAFLVLKKGFEPRKLLRIKEKFDLLDLQIVDNNNGVEYNFTMKF